MAELVAVVAAVVVAVAVVEAVAAVANSFAAYYLRYEDKAVASAGADWSDIQVAVERRSYQRSDVAVARSDDCLDVFAKRFADATSRFGPIVVVVVATTLVGVVAAKFSSADRSPDVSRR